MVDFIAECRPCSFRAPVESPSGFVAEVRRSSRHPVVPTTPMTSKVIDHAGSMSEYMNKPTHGDPDRALNEVLFNKSNSRDKMTHVMHTTIVKLINTLLNGFSVTSIKGSIIVSLAESEQPICLELNESYQSPKHVSPDCSEISSVIKGKGFVGRQMSPVSPSTSDDMSSPEESDCYGKYSPPYFNRDIPSVAPLSAGTLEDEEHITPTCGVKREGTSCHSNAQNVLRKSRDSEKYDSEGESGYCSAERESISDEGGEETVEVHRLQLNSNKDNCQQQDQKPKIENIDVNEPQLVIDLSMSCDEKCITKIDEKVTTNTSEKIMDLIDEEKKTEDSSTQMQENNSDADMDAHMDLSGDCLVNMNTQGSAEPEKKREFVLSSKVTCKKCPAMLPDLTTYEEHALQEHQMYACSTCYKDFSSKNNLKRHVRIHTGSRPYKCKQCDQSFARKDDLKGHTLKHDFSKPFRCSLCGKGYTDRACVKNHMSKEHCSRLMQICPQCGESFDREEAFLEHKKTHPSLKQFSCDTCPFIGTNHLMALKHKLLHSFKLFSCKPCNAYFADPFGYTKHVRKHKKNKGYSFYVCCFCDTILPTYEQFVRHEYSHAQGKLHECNVCSKQFKSKTSMLEHSLAHTDSASTDKPEIEIEIETKNKTNDDMDCSKEEGSVSSPALENTDEPDKRPECHGRNDTHMVTYSSDSGEGNLLDLTFKPRSLDTSSLHAPTGIASTELDTVSDISNCHRTQSSSNYCAPRNGCATIETRVPQQEKSSQYRGLDDETSAKEETFQIVWRSHKYDERPSVNQRTENRVTRVDSNHIPALSSLISNFEETRQETPMPGPEHSRNDNNNSRHHPYSKLIDLHKKFIAARGGLDRQRRLKEIGNSQSSAALRQDPMHRRSPPNVTSSTATEGYETKAKLEAPPMIIGLSGKPYIPPSNEELTKKRSDRTSPILTRVVPEKDAVPSPTTDNNTVGTNSPIGHRSRDDRSSSNSYSVEQTPRECDICNMTFESFSQLESHSVVNHSRYMCEFCGKGFTARPNRDRHVRYHTGERPYKCELCTSAFFRGDDLKYHRTTRHPMEQISCHKCSATFTWHKDLERHLRQSKCVAY